MIETRSGIGWRRLTGFVVALVAALVIFPAGPAHAHADLVSSDPAEGAVLEAVPDEIRLEFSEPVTGVPKGVQVFDAGGGVVASSAAVSGPTLRVTLDEEVGDGTLVVTWRVISDDGHPVSGSLSFSVGTASATVATPPAASTSTVSVPPGLTAARWIGYVGLLLCVGLVWFTSVLLPAAPVTARARGRLVRTARVAAPITALVWLVGLPLTALYQSGGGAGSLFGSAVWTTLTRTEYGVAGAVAVGVLAAMASLGDGSPDRSRRAAALVAGTVAVIAPALTGHTRAASPEVLVVATGMLHLLAGSIWLGGLVALVLVLPDLAGRGTLGAETLARFSTLAAGVLAALVATGSVLAWRIVGSVDALLSTGYGQLLLAKIALALLAVAIAAWNRYALLPRLRGKPRDRDRAAALGLVVRTTAAEAVLLVIVLLVTGVLVDRNPEGPGIGASSSETEQTGMLGAYQVTATLEPLETGPNTVTIETRDSTDEPFEGFEAPRVRLESDDVDLGEVTLTSAAPGVYTGDVVLPSPGTWRLQVSLRVTEFDNPVQTFEFSVGGG